MAPWIPFLGWFGGFLCLFWRESVLACKQGTKGAEGEREFQTDSVLNMEPPQGTFSQP